MQQPERANKAVEPSDKMIDCDINTSKDALSILSGQNKGKVSLYTMLSRQKTS